MLGDGGVVLDRGQEPCERPSIAFARGIGEDLRALRGAAGGRSDEVGHASRAASRSRG